MVKVGYFLSSEEFGPNELIEQTKMAEAASFGAAIALRHQGVLRIVDAERPRPTCARFRSWRTRHRSGSGTRRVRPAGYTSAGDVRRSSNGASRAKTAGRSCFGYRTRN